MIPAGSLGVAALLAPGWRPDLPLAGALGFGLLAFLGALALVDMSRRSALPPTRRVPERRRRPFAGEAWLHVVSGPTPARVAAAVRATATPLLAAGHRVLVMDAGRGLELHTAYGREARWGVGECLSEGLPVLGVVQRTGVPSLSLLARGALARAEDWPQLGRLLDEARPHFGHCILALDAHAPHEAGDALRDRSLKGWWGDTGALPKAALALSERLGITIVPLGLGYSAEESREAVRVPGESGVGVALAPAPEPIVVATPTLSRRAVPPAVLDCDLRVRERLRFLIWMRSLHTPSVPARRPA